MTDFEKLVAKTKNAMCVEEVIKKITYYNCFGDSIREDISTTKSVFVFDNTTGEWVKGIERGEAK